MRRRFCTTDCAASWSERGRHHARVPRTGKQLVDRRGREARSAGLVGGPEAGSTSPLKMFRSRRPRPSRVPGLPKSQSFLGNRHQTTDKCRRARHRKLIRISAHAPSAENSYVLAESGPRLRVRIKRPEIGGRIRTVCGNSGPTVRNADGSGLLPMVGCFLLARFRTDARLDPEAEKMPVAAIRRRRR
jgi:hypothetical protein